MVGFSLGPRHHQALVTKSNTGFLKNLLFDFVTKAPTKVKPWPKAWAKAWGLVVSFGLDANVLVQLVMPAVQIVLGSVFMTVCGFCCVLEVLACGGRTLTFQATMRSS